MQTSKHHLDDIDSIAASSKTKQLHFALNRQKRVENRRIVNVHLNFHRFVAHARAIQFTLSRAIAIIVDEISHVSAKNIIYLQTLVHVPHLHRQTKSNSKRQRVREMLLIANKRENERRTKKEIIIFSYRHHESICGKPTNETNEKKKTNKKTRVCQSQLTKRNWWKEKLRWKNNTEKSLMEKSELRRRKCNKATANEWNEIWNEKKRWKKNTNQMKQRRKQTAQIERVRRQFQAAMNKILRSMRFFSSLVLLHYSLLFLFIFLFSVPLSPSLSASSSLVCAVAFILVYTFFFLLWDGKIKMFLICLPLLECVNGAQRVWMWRAHTPVASFGRIRSDQNE